MSSNAKNLKQSKRSLKTRKGHEKATPDKHAKWAEFIEQIRKELGWTMDEMCEFTDVDISWLKKARGGHNIRGDFREKFENALNKKWKEKFPDKPPLPWPAWIDDAPWSDKAHPVHLGWKAAKIESCFEIVDLKGNAIARRVFRGIQPEPGIILNHIPGQIVMLTPGSRIVSGPKLADLSAQAKGLDLVVKRHGDAIQSYRVLVANGLASDDPPLSFSIETRFERAVLMTTEEVRDAYASDEFQWDYFSYDVVVPTDLLTLEVSFPRETTVELFPNVFFAWSELVCHPELRRTRNGFDVTPNRARFVVRNPRIGFRYLIYWTFLEGR
jgi:transcriptional regulator with XRE-family HTH domain